MGKKSKVIFSLGMIYYAGDFCWAIKPEITTPTSGG
jgi:hypothetical protein